MSNIAIRVEGLGKRYYIGGSRERYRTLRDTLTRAIESPFRRAGKLLRGQATGAAELGEPIWALRDVSFEVQQGEVIGIIGRNGAGKTTLLKILSRITEPTRGYADVYGRIGSLLEVGTGFHPELTGRENVYLNGAILGMVREEIDRKFDEIVDFSGVEKFIDTPVKHFSSGMYVRLAFAVAAHLEPEILMVDEVLAVGDLAFQKKCLGKIGEVAGEGRTVLFVSHNMGAIANLCEKVVYLSEGRVKRYSATQDAINEYVSDTNRLSEVPLGDRQDREGSGKIKATSVSAFACGSGVGEGSSVILGGADVCIAISFQVIEATDRVENVTVALGIDDMIGTRLFTLWSKYTGENFVTIPDAGRFICKIPDLPLRSGVYVMHVYIDSNGKLADYVQNAFRFDVGQSRFYASHLEPSASQGHLLVNHSWSLA